jgi:uncharacterized protein YegP (UPF0339 family)
MVSRLPPLAREAVSYDHLRGGSEPTCGYAVQRSVTPFGMAKRMSTNVYRDLFGAWRWEFEDINGDIIDSPSSYDTRNECIKAAADAGFDVSPFRNTLARSITHHQQQSGNER